ncbi:MAG: DNA primase [Candidatus Omnitrophica bacterium]|nr:DNA primase [Candidatus Omnitrophota bacterium]
MRYDDRIVDEVRAANDIVDVISAYIPLKRAGRNFKALSPFKPEKTPSFMVSPEKQIFHCFSTGIGGDVFSFLMKYENLSFPEALRLLAERANIRIPEQSGGSREDRSETERFYEAYQVAAEYYHRQLLDPQNGQAARKYLIQRKFDEALVKEFKLGWAPDGWRGLFDLLTRKGFSEEMLMKASLIKKSEKGNCYDVFRNRVIFPIHNLSGKVVGFGGRLISGDAGGGPKYLNSPETPIFKKRKELFGLFMAKKNIDPSRPRMIVVEGYIDFLSLYAAGFKNAVATLGTALTEEHVQTLKRFVDEAIVIYDGDAAGIRASLKGLEIFLQGGMNVKLVQMPAGLDPDDYLKKEGTGKFGQLLETAKDFFDYKLDILKKQYDLQDSLGLMRVSADFIETLSKVKDPILSAHYVRRLAGELNLEEDIIRTELQKFKEKAVRSHEPSPGETKKEAHAEARSQKAFETEEVLLLAHMIDDEKMLALGVRELKESDFGDKRLGLLFRDLTLRVEHAQSLQLASILASIQDEGLKRALVRIAATDWPADERKKAFSDCLQKIRQKQRTRKLMVLKGHIQQAEKNGDTHALTQLVKEYQELLKTPQI